MTSSEHPKPENMDPAPVATLLRTLLNAAVEQEIAGVAALTAGLQMAMHPGSKPRPEAELEADFDNMPI